MGRSIVPVILERPELELKVRSRGTDERDRYRCRVLAGAAPRAWHHRRRSRAIGLPR